MRCKEKILKILESYSYVSFDIFDTLILRNLGKPSDLFFFMEKELEMNGNPYKNFHDERIKAEIKAISQNETTEEITLDNIYQNLNFDTDPEKETVKKLEIELEIEFCMANTEMVDVLNWAKQQGKTIIITSDMYLPRFAILQMLQKCSISYDHLYVSSEYGIRKSSGKLFHYILDDLAITKNNIIHIGDNRKSDWLLPKVVGIASYFYKFKPSIFLEPSAVYGRNIFSRALYAIKRNKTAQYDCYESIGYNYLGPLLTGFIQWLVEDVTRKEMDNILFFSRDGFIMQKAFQILCPEKHSEYVVISRRSVTVPQLEKAKNWRDVVEILAYVKRTETWASLLHKMGIDENNSVVKSLEKKYGKMVTKEQLLHMERFQEAFHIIKDAVWENAKKEKLEALKYLNRYFTGHVAIVDIGWYGTMQQNLERLLDSSDVTMEGYYVGLLPKQGYGRERRKGFIYDINEYTPFNPSLIYGFNGLIESFFSANHGSAKKYVDRQPVLEEWESENWPIISKIQDGALAFCRDVKWLIERYSVIIDNVEAYKGMQRLFIKPSKNEIYFLGKLVFYDTYYEPLIKFGRGRHYLRKPMDFMKDLLASNWKIGFLKNLTGLGCSYRLYMAMLKLKK